MKFYKSLISLSLAICISCVTPLGFAATKKLSLDESIQLSKENSALVRSIENKAYDTDRMKKNNIQLLHKVESGLDGFYSFVETYNAVIAATSPRNPYYGLKKYIGRSKAALETDVETLTKQYEMMMASGYPPYIAQAGQLLDVISFLEAYMMLGDTAELTKETKYELFKKNEALLKNSIDLIDTKFDQGLIAAERGTEAGVIKLYVGLSDLGAGIDVKKELLAVYREALENMRVSHEKGLVSTSAYENQVRSVEIMELEVENMTYQYENLMDQLKLMCEVPFDSQVIQSTVFNHSEEVLLNPEDYYEKAYSSNMDYLNLKAELTYNEKNFAVMNKYLKDIDIDNETDTPIKVYYQEKEDMKDLLNELTKKINNKKQLIECNVQAAYNDLAYKKKTVEDNELNLKLAEAQLNATAHSYSLGLKTSLDLDQVKLNRENVKYTADVNVRAYNTSVERFKLLINYGVAYEL